MEKVKKLGRKHTERQKNIQKGRGENGEGKKMRQKTYGEAGKNLLRQEKIC